MSARNRKRRGPSERGTPPDRGTSRERTSRERGTSRARRLVIGALALVAIGAAAWIAVSWRAVSWRAAPWRAAPPSPAVGPPTLAALGESISVAEAAHDWARLLAHLEHLAAAAPPSSEVQLALGAAWNNYAWAGGRAESHAARTSLERAAFEKRAFQCLDSAAALARSDEEVVRIRLMRGRIYEAVGLPLDGLAQYQDALRRSPDNAEAKSRIAGVGRRLGYSNRPTEPR